jgi:chromate reductase
VLGEVLPPEASLTIIASPDLPLFNNDLEDPPPVLALKEAVANAHGVVIAVPEYNYSIPGGLKNALDWLSRPPISSPMKGKPIGIMGAAAGMSGTIRAQLHLREMLIYSDSPCMAQPEVLIPRAHERIDKATGTLHDASTRELIRLFGAQFLIFVRRYTNES